MLPSKTNYRASRDCPTETTSFLLFWFAITIFKESFYTRWYIDMCCFQSHLSFLRVIACVSLCIIFKNEEIIIWEISMKRSSQRHNLFMFKLKYSVILSYIKYLLSYIKYWVINITQLNLTKVQIFTEQCISTENCRFTQRHLDFTSNRYIQYRHFIHLELNNKWKRGNTGVRKILLQGFTVNWFKLQITWSYPQWATENEP